MTDRVYIASYHYTRTHTRTPYEHNCTGRQSTAPNFKNRNVNSILENRETDQINKLFVHKRIICMSHTHTLPYVLSSRLNNEKHPYSILGDWRLSSLFIFHQAHDNIYYYKIATAAGVLDYHYNVTVLERT